MGFGIGRMWARAGPGLPGMGPRSSAQDLDCQGVLGLWTGLLVLGRERICRWGGGPSLVSQDSGDAGGKGPLGVSSPPCRLEQKHHQHLVRLSMALPSCVLKDELAPPP